MSTAPNTPNSNSSGCVAGLFHSGDTAEQAIEMLKRSGYSDNEIGIATAGNRNESHDTASFWHKVRSTFGKQEHVESASDLEGSLRDSGMPEQQAQYFNRSLSDGDILLTVRAQGERAVRASEILRQVGADVADNAEMKGLSGSGEERTRGRENLASVQGERRIQLMGEVLNVHKQRVERGAVRISKEVITENKTLEVPVTREELVIERVPGHGREAAGQIGGGENEVRVPLSEEHVKVEKKPVLNEEVRVGKKQVQETKRVSDSVRHEELRTEMEGKGSDRPGTEERGTTTDKKRRTA
jgi:uncharacterized protein (TIGR02271 family)